MQFEEFTEILFSETPTAYIELYDLSTERKILIFIQTLTIRPEMFIRFLNTSAKAFKI